MSSTMDVAPPAPPPAALSHGDVDALASRCTGAARLARLDFAARAAPRGSAAHARALALLLEQLQSAGSANTAAYKAACALAGAAPDAAWVDATDRAAA